MIRPGFVRTVYERVFRRYTTRCPLVSPLNNRQCQLPRGHKGYHVTMPTASLHVHAGPGQDPREQQ